MWLNPGIPHRTKSVGVYDYIWTISFPFFPAQMNSSYETLDIKLYLANVQGNILNDSSTFTIAGSTEQVENGEEWRPGHPHDRVSNVCEGCWWSETSGLISKHFS